MAALITMLVVGWIIVCGGLCLSVCMLSARISRKLEEDELGEAGQGMARSLLAGSAALPGFVVHALPAASSARALPPRLVEPGALPVSYAARKVQPCPGRHTRVRRTVQEMR